MCIYIQTYIFYLALNMYPKVFGGAVNFQLFHSTAIFEKGAPHDKQMTLTYVQGQKYPHAFQLHP